MIILLVITMLYSFIIFHMVAIAHAISQAVAANPMPVFRMRSTTFRRHEHLNSRYDPQTFSLNDVSTFRFSNDELRTICDTLVCLQSVRVDGKLQTTPDPLYPDKYCVFSPLEGMQILCVTLANPTKFAHVAALFHTGEARVTLIYHTMVHLLWTDLHHLLQFNPARFNHRLPEFSAAIARHTNLPPPFNQCAGFVDAKTFPIAKPCPSNDGGHGNALQAAFFDGHKWTHGVKVQQVALLNGLMTAWGPIDAFHHDAYICHLSNLIPQLTQMTDPLLGEFFLFGDAGYPLRRQLHRIAKNVAPGSPAGLYNRMFSSIRISVEWNFGGITNVWARPSLKKELKLFAGSRQSAAKQVMMAFLMQNLLTCVKGQNETSKYFGCPPPTLINYLTGVW